MCVCVYVLEVELASGVSEALDFLATPARKATASAESVFIVMTLLMLQCFR